MAEKKGLDLVLAARRKGWITQDQMTEAVREAGATDGSDPLEVLVARGRLSREQADALGRGSDGDCLSFSGAGPPPGTEADAGALARTVAYDRNSAHGAAVSPDAGGLEGAPGGAARGAPGAAGRPGSGDSDRTVLKSAGAGKSAGSVRVGPGPAPSTPTPGRKPGDPDGTGRLGPYTLFRVLGSGGMGVVYEAVHDRLPRKVALKCLPSALATHPSAVQRFLREARAASRLQHPNLVPVFDVGQAGQTWYFAMEYIEGETLDELVKAKRLSLDDAARAARDVARGLACAHAQGILHRDVKPANIIREPGGRVVLTDFGLSLQSDLAALTAAGKVVGTAAFMSPEQASGDREAMDARTDVYSLGATLYHLSTGRAPFEGRSFEGVLANVLLREPAPPRTLNRRITEDLETITLKAMEKEPSRRYPSADAFADDLERFLRGDAIQARPTSVVGRIARKAARHPRWVAVACALLAVAVAGGLAVASSVLKARREVELRKAEAERQEAERVRHEEAAARARAIEDEARALAAQAAAIRLQDRAAALRLLERAVDLAPVLPELYLQRGRTHRDGGDWKKAVKDFSKAIELSPKTIEGYFERGITSYMAQDHLKVFGDLQTVLTMQPNHPLADVGRGCVAYLQMKWKACIASMTKALEKDPKNALAYAIRGEASVQMGKPDEGALDFERALQIEPQNLTALTARAALRLGQGRNAEAVADADASVRVFAANAIGLQFRGIAKARLGRFAEAVLDLEAAARLRPLREDGWFALAESDYMIGRLERAEELAGKAAEHGFSGPLCAFLRGMARAELGKLDAADEDLATLEQAAPGDVLVALLRAELTLKRGDASAGHRALHPSESKGPAPRAEWLPLFRVVHGRVLAGEGKTAEALKEFDAALKSAPSIEPLIRADLAALRK
ncbi:MAG: protein kinase [Planctomycetes bacterium]|nr:protein kinase [Planctomycetota bacterium]